MQNKWTYRGGFGDVEFELGPTRASGDGREASMRELHALVYAFKHRDPDARRVVVAIYGRLLGGYPGAAPEANDLDLRSPRAEAIGEEIIRAGRAGLLVATKLKVRTAARAVSPSAAVASPAAPPVPEDSPEPTGWIEIALFDAADRPVPDADYRIECADGTVRTGTTDDTGHAREDGIVPGTCNVTFTQIHAPSWAKA